MGRNGAPQTPSLSRTYLLGRVGSQLEAHSVSVVRAQPKVSGVNDDLWGPNRSLKFEPRRFYPCPSVSQIVAAGA